ncbi:hypothetical protein LWI28_000193 [Acer negundo]|uniref:Uncharacterized protein n=1 Tax=Acer negundo TaxID=4023 RepID=A0AAD5J973_ACENE|nr:hypothetical protein LWI28_000193 [Acer negundo]
MKPSRVPETTVLQLPGSGDDVDGFGTSRVAAGSKEEAQEIEGGDLEGGGKGIKSSIGNDGLDISERRSLFQKRAWGVVMELLSQKGRGSLLEIESKTGMGSSANKFSSSSTMFSEDIRVVDSDRHGPCVVEGDLGGPTIDVFVNLRDKVSVTDEWDCSNLGVTSISATRRQGGKSFFPSRSLCMKIRSISLGFDYNSLEKEGNSSSEESLSYYQPINNEDEDAYNENNENEDEVHNANNGNAYGNDSPSNVKRGDISQ